MARDANTERQNRMPLVALLIAGSVSQVGSALTLIAVPWFVLQTTGSATKTGLTGAAATLPYVIGGVFGGGWVDRLGFRRMSIAADMTSGLAIVLVPLLSVTMGLAYWQLLALVFLGSLCNTPGDTARRSALPDLAAAAKTSLERANAAAQSIPRLATLLGPPLAGVLIVVLGATTVLYVDAATFAFSALAIALCVPGNRIAAPAAIRGQYWADLRAGWQFIRREPVVRALATTSAIMNFFDAPFSLLLALLVTATTHRVQDLGLYVASFGAGALVASLSYGVIGTRLPRRVPIFLWMGGFAVVNGILATTPPRPVILIALVTMGLAAGLVNPTMSTVMQERIPANLRGRVFGLLTAASFVAIPFGRGLAGVIAGAVGVQWVYIGIAVAYAIAFITALVLPAYRALDERPSTNGYLAPSPTNRAQMSNGSPR